MNHKALTVTVAENGTYSGGFTVPVWGMFYGALFPDMDAGDIGLEISMDNGSNYYPVLNPADGADAVLVASGSDPGWIDFSDWIRFMPGDGKYMARFTCASQTSGAVTINVSMRG